MLRQVQIQSQLGALHFSYGFAKLLGSNDLGKVQGQNFTLLTVVFRSLGPTNLGVISCRIV